MAEALDAYESGLVAENTFSNGAESPIVISSSEESEEEMMDVDEIERVFLEQDISVDNND